MKSAARIVVALVTVPHMVGCFAVLPTPIPPTPAERQALSVRGVVMGGEADNGGERVEFGGVENVTWTEDAVSIVGVPRAGPEAGQLTERRYPLSSLSAVLVRQVEPARTSAIIGATLVVTAAVLAFLVDGFTGQDPPGGRDPRQLQGGGR